LRAARGRRGQRLLPARKIIPHSVKELVARNGFDERVRARPKERDPLLEDEVIVDESLAPDLFQVQRLTRADDRNRARPRLEGA